MSAPPTGPAAAGVRVAYDALPPAVRGWVETTLGSPVTQARTQPGGFSPGVAARLVCADGSRAFVKAVSADANPDTPGLHRREIEVLRILPAELPVPKLIASYDDDPWVALLVEDADGRHPHVPWRDDELDRMLELTRRVVACRGVEVRPAREHVVRWTGWGKVEPAELDDWALRHHDRLVALEAQAVEVVDGDYLAHLDTRADNVLLGGAVDWLVDWPWAAAGPRWLDPVVSAPAVAMQGGPDPEVYLARSQLVSASDADAVTAVVAAFTGMLTWLASLPPPRGLPTVREFQAAQARLALDWLRARTRW